MVDRHDGPRAARDPPPHRSRIDVECVGVHVGKYGHQPLIEEAGQRPHVRNRRNNHFASRGQLQGAKGEVHSRCSAGARDAVLPAVHRRELFLKLKYLRSCEVEEHVGIDYFRQVFLFQLAVTFAEREGRSFRFGSAVEREFFVDVKRHRSRPCDRRVHLADGGDNVVGVTLRESGVD